MSNFPFQPWGSRLVVEPDDRPEATQHGAIITLQGYGGSAEDPMTTGRVVAAGDEVAFHDELVGTRVVFSPWAGFKLTVGGKAYNILDRSEVLGTLTEEAHADVS